jgi:hypothetical protein
MGSDCRIGLYQGRGRPAWPRRDNSAERPHRLNATTSSEHDHIVEGDSFKQAAHHGGAGIARPADIDEARGSL